MKESDRNLNQVKNANINGRMDKNRTIVKYSLKEKTINAINEVWKQNIIIGKKKYIHKSTYSSGL